MKLLKKLTLKDLNNFKPGTLKAAVTDSEEAVFVGRILGSVRAQQVIPSPYGEAIKFKGTFQGYGVDGEEARSTVAYFPSPVDELLSNQIREIQGDKDRLETPVEIALDVFAVADKGETGYKYICKPLLETKVADPIAALLAQVKPLQLAAPVAEETPPVEAVAVEPTEKKASSGKK